MPVMQIRLDCVAVASGELPEQLPRPGVPSRAAAARLGTAFMCDEGQVRELRLNASPKGLPALQHRLQQPCARVPVQRAVSGDEV